MIKIIHILDVIKETQKKAGSSIYIGRKNKRHSRSRSPLCNPFSVEDHGREGCCDKFKTEKLLPAMEKGEGPVYEAVERIAIAELLGEDTRLACWCMSEECPDKRPSQRCHGLSIREAAMELVGGGSLASKVEQMKAKKIPGLGHSMIDGLWVASSTVEELWGRAS